MRKIQKVSIPSNRGSVSDLKQGMTTRQIASQSQSPLIGAVFLTLLSKKKLSQSALASQSPLIGAVFLTKGHERSGQYLNCRGSLNPL